MVARIRITGISDVFRQAEADLVIVANQLARAQALQAITALRQATPVDTGRARASWLLTEDSPEFFDFGDPAGTRGGLLSSTTGIPPAPGSLLVQYITNGVPYIADLNRGTSRQAPRRFIEQTLMQFFDPTGVQVQVRGDTL